MEIFGYVRVSSTDQNEARQMLDMKKLKVNSKNIYIDKQSGKDFNRPNYKKLISIIKKGRFIIRKKGEIYYT